MELSSTPDSALIYASVDSISFNLEAIHRFQLYARCQILNNSLDTYVKIASLSAKFIIYSIMQITSVTGLISYIQHFISMHLNIYLGNFCILDSYAHFNVRIFLLFFFIVLRDYQKDRRTHRLHLL